MAEQMHGEFKPLPSRDGRLHDDGIIDAKAGVEDPIRIAAELQGVVDDVNQFLSDWCRRLDQRVSTLSDTNTAPDAILQRRIDEFRREQRRQDSIRQAEQRDLQVRSESLAAAWLQLEAEQRAFLQMKATTTPAHVSRDATPTADPPRRAGPSAEPAAAEQHVAVDVPTSDSRVSAAIPQRPTSTPQTRDSAVRQFERLRREIEASRPNKTQQTEPTSFNRPLAEGRS